MRHQLKQFWRNHSREIRRTLLNFWVALLLFIIIADGLPHLFPGHKRIKDALDPILDVTGLWQGSWQLFAPNPDNLNTWIEAEVKFSDGSTWTWTTPNWQERNLFEKFIQGRHPKFSDHFRLDRNKAIWPYIADYLARIAPRPAPGIEPTKVSLTRHWWEVPKPDEADAEREKYGQVPPPRDKFPHKKKYYTRRIK